MQHGSNEAFSRVLIDKALEFSGWDLLDQRQVRFELYGATGRADYVLNGERGALSVLEAKREDADPYDAKEQARGYAENLRAPFIILSNGREHWFWNYTRKHQDAFRIERLPSLADLEWLRLKNLLPPRPLGGLVPIHVAPRIQCRSLITTSRLNDSKTLLRTLRRLLNRFLERKRLYVATPVQ